MTVVSEKSLYEAGHKLRKSVERTMLVIDMARVPRVENFDAVRRAFQEWEAAVQAYQDASNKALRLSVYI